MEKIWYKNYDPGVPHTVNPDQYFSLVHLLEESFSQYSNRACFVNYGETLTYKQLDNKSKILAGFFQKKLKLPPGSRIAIMMPSILQYPVVLFAALRAGLIVVNVNPLSTYKELNVILKNTGAKCVMVYENFAHILVRAMISTEVEHVIHTKIGDLFPFFKRGIVNFWMKHIKKKVPEWHIAGAIPFREALQSRYKEKFEKVILNLEDIAFLQFSGGRTTGDENCVMLTHRNIISNVLQASCWFESFLRAEHGGGMINPFPFSKAICMTTSFFMMRVGRSVILITDPKDIESFSKELKRTKFSIMFGINSFFSLLMQNENFCRLDFSSLRFTASGGMSVQNSVAEKWKILTGSTILQGYGLTEASPLVSLIPFTMHRFSGSVGLPLPSTNVRICDEEGNEVSTGEMGELWIHGPQVMKGYWNDVEKTKKVLTEEGWLRTGDIVRMDQEGFLYILDRKEDVIIVAGKKIYSPAVEEVIAGIEGVQEVAVVGVKHPDGRQIVTAFVVRNSLSVTEGEIKRTCQEVLEDYQIPQMVEFCAALPKTSVGYVLRRILREEIAQTKLD